MNLMLYIHVPFCSARCSYCSFYSRVHSEKDFLLYKNTLLQEIQNASVFHYLPEYHHISSIFFGGGTPSLLPAEYIIEILSALRKRYSVDSNAEITLEANPESITLQKALLWKEAGISRISMGCQSFQPAMLKILQRVHSVQDIYTAIEYLQKASLTNMSIDLMWGLLHQNTKNWLNELAIAVKLPIQHISTYSLTIEENSSLYHTPQCIPKTHEDTLCEMYTKGIQFLEEHNFYQYELSNFAKKDFVCEHNMGYWNKRSYHGFGPSASSYIHKDDLGESYRYTHPHSFLQWTKNILNTLNGSSLHKNTSKETINSFIHLRESIMLGLRQKKGFYFPLYEEIMSISLMESHADLIKNLEQQNFLSSSKTHYTLTTKGLLCSDAIIDAFTRDIPLC